MHYFQPYAKPTTWFLIGLILLFTTIGNIFVESYFLQQATHEQREKTEDRLSLLRAKIENVIYSNIQLVQGFASVISTTPDIDQNYFAQISKNILNKSSIIRNIAGAPNMVISLMYPIEGNEAAIGLNYTKHPQQSAAAKTAIDSGELVLAGPVDLTQGGIGFIARIPVYISTAGKSEKGELWGLLSSVMNAQEFYQQAGLLGDELKLQVAIKGKDAKGIEGAHFFGNESVYQQIPVTEQINLPYGLWQLAAIPTQGWLKTSPYTWEIRTVSLLTIISLITLVIFSSRNLYQQRQLKDDLKSSNDRFTSVLDSMNAVVYVADISTNEILYANPKTKSLFGKGIIGKKCWQTLQKNQNLPCAFCSNAELLDENGNSKPLHTDEFENTYTGNWYHCEVQAIRWDDGRMVRLEVATDITLIKQHQKLLSDAHKNLKKVAYFDPLTRLPNRRMLTNRFDQMVSSLKSNKEHLIICYLDLDGFKQINDLHGHQTGDRLLKRIGDRLRKVIKQEDTISRWGGDEFTLLLRINSIEDARAMLQTTLDSVTRVYNLDDLSLSISASIGVAIYTKTHCDIDTLLRQADQAMYTAKKRGKNRYCFFDADKDRKVHALQEQIAEISHAISNHEMVLFYQPKLSLSKARVYGVEVLIRWMHPENGLTQPIDFLPYIHGSDIQTKLDWWVIKTATNQALQWQENNIDLNVSINVSPQTLQRDDFTQRLKRVLDERELQPNRIELEILESEVADIEKIVQLINQLMDFNIGFALDDYGTGYSSLTYLRKLPVQTVKIDQSFVRDMLVDQSDLNIVEGVISLARVFKRDVIAEGVETIEHGVKLASMDCTNLQGYGIAKPMPLDEFTQWMEQYEIPEQWCI